MLPQPPQAALIQQSYIIANQPPQNNYVVSDPPPQYNIQNPENNYGQQQNNNFNFAPPPQNFNNEAQ